MSLPRRERRALRQIEAGISRSDPGLAQLLGGFHELASGQAVPSDEPSRGSTGLTVAVSVMRLAARGAAAAAAVVYAPGVRERLGVRSQPQPMARSTWQRLT
jgi:hypothetical protein